MTGCCHFPCFMNFFNIDHSSLPSFIPHVLSGILLAVWHGGFFVCVFSFLFVLFYDSFV